MINRLGSNDRGLGRADFTLVLGGAGSQVVAGDFDGDGVDTLLAVPGAGWVAGEWDGDGREQLGRFDAGRARFELFASDGGPLASFFFGNPGWQPVGAQLR